MEHRNKKEGKLKGRNLYLPLCLTINLIRARFVSLKGIIKELFIWLSESVFFFFQEGHYAYLWIDTLIIFLTVKIICLTHSVKIMMRLATPSCSYIKDSPVLKRRLDAAKIYISQFFREDKLGFYIWNLGWKTLGSCLLLSSLSLSYTY